MPAQAHGSHRHRSIARAFHGSPARRFRPLFFASASNSTRRSPPGGRRRRPTRQQQARPGAARAGPRRRAGPRAYRPQRGRIGLLRHGRLARRDHRARIPAGAPARRRCRCSSSIPTTRTASSSITCRRCRPTTARCARSTGTRWSTASRASTTSRTATAASSASSRSCTASSCRCRRWHWARWRRTRITPQPYARARPAGSARSGAARARAAARRRRARAAAARCVYLLGSMLNGPREAPPTLAPAHRAAAAELRLRRPCCHSGGDGAARVSGFVSLPQDMARVEREVRGMPGVSAASFQLQLRVWPHCEVVAILKPYQARNLDKRHGLRIAALSAQHGRLREGDLVLVQVNQRRLRRLSAGSTTSRPTAPCCISTPSRGQAPAARRRERRAGPRHPVELAREPALRHGADHGPVLAHALQRQRATGRPSSWLRPTCSGCATRSPPTKGADRLVADFAVPRNSR